jgi:hypothetical protein
MSESVTLRGRSFAGGYAPALVADTTTMPRAKEPVG